MLQFVPERDSEIAFFIGNISWAVYDLYKKWIAWVNKNQYFLRIHLQYFCKMNWFGFDDFENCCPHTLCKRCFYCERVNRVSDSIIKDIGQWKSSAYIKYISVIIASNTN